MDALTRHGPDHLQSPLRLCDLRKSIRMMEIFNHLELPSLTMLGMTSKKWKKITAELIWQKINQLFLSNQKNSIQTFDNYIQSLSKDSAYKYLNDLLPSILDPYLKFTAENWLKYIGAKILIEEDDPESDDVAAYLLSHLCNDKNVNPVVTHLARDASAIMVLQEPHLNAQFVKNIVTFNKNDSKEVLEAQTFIAELHQENQAWVLKDNTIVKLLKNIQVHKNTTSRIQAYAEFMSARLACEGRNPDMRLDKAVELLQKIRDKSTPILQLKAEYHIAIMQAQGWLSTDNYELVAKTLLQVTNHHSSTGNMRTQAHFHLAKLALNKKTTLIDKNSALEFMQTVPRIGHLSEVQRYESAVIVKENSTDYYIKPIAHFSPGNEMLILDPKDSFIMKEHFQMILKKISQQDTRIILSIVKNHLENDIFQPSDSHLTLQLATFISLKKSKDISSIPNINLEEFLAHGFGCNRHYTLAAAYILDGLTKEISPLTKKPYLSGTVRIICDDRIKSVPCDWVYYSNDKDQILLDPMSSRCIDFATSINKLEQEHGAKLIQYLLEKSNNFKSDRLVSFS